MEKLFCKNQPKIGKNIRFTVRLEETFISKPLNRFASTLARNLTMELLSLKDSIGVKRWRLPNTIEIKRQKLLGILRVK